LSLNRQQNNTSNDLFPRPIFGLRQPIESMFNKTVSQ
jgi:hypothetical protein